MPESSATVLTPSDRRGNLVNIDDISLIWEKKNILVMFYLLKKHVATLNYDFKDITLDLSSFILV